MSTQYWISLNFRGTWDKVSFKKRADLICKSMEVKKSKIGKKTLKIAKIAERIAKKNRKWRSIVGKYGKHSNKRSLF